MGGRLSQRHAALPGNPPSGLSRRPRYGGPTCGGMEEPGTSLSHGTPAENYTETRSDPGHQTCCPVDRRTAIAARPALSQVPGLARPAKTRRRLPPNSRNFFSTWRACTAQHLALGSFPAVELPFHLAVAPGSLHSG